MIKMMRTALWCLMWTLIGFLVSTAANRLWLHP